MISRFGLLIRARKGN